MNDKIKYALEQVENGDPLKDFLDDDEILDALIIMHNTIEGLLGEISYDNVKPLMELYGFDPYDCELGDVMVAVRKLLRQHLSIYYE